jgi:hypothetical protein
VNTVDARNDAVRAAWVKPSLVEKPLDETRSGLGRINDGAVELQS